MLRGRGTAKKENSAWKGQSNWLPRPVMSLCSICHMNSWQLALVGSGRHTTKLWIKTQRQESSTLNQKKFPMFLVQRFQSWAATTFKPTLSPSYSHTYLPCSKIKAQYINYLRPQIHTALCSRVTLSSTRWRSILTQFRVSGKRAQGCQRLRGSFLQLLSVLIFKGVCLWGSTKN